MMLTALTASIRHTEGLHHHEQCPALLFQVGHSMCKPYWPGWACKVQMLTAVLSLQVNNPATDEIIANVACMKAADTKSAIAAASAAFPSWSRKTAKERGSVLRR